MAGIRLDEEGPQMSLLKYGTRQNAGSCRAWAFSGILGGGSQEASVLGQVTPLIRSLK